jgi:type IV pilus assembly protein PilB
MTKVQLLETGNAHLTVSNVAQLGLALQSQRNFRHVQLGQLLLHEEVITRQQLVEALEVQRHSPERKLGDILADNGAVTLEQIHLAVARSLGAPVVNLEGFDFDVKALSCVTAELARVHNIIPLMLQDEHLVVAMENLLDSDDLTELGFVTQRSIVPVYASRGDIEHAINQHYDATEQERDLSDLQLSNFYHEDDKELWQEAERLANEAPIVKLVNNIILDAIHQRASDIHIRPGNKSIELLYRIDGALVAKRDLQKGLLPAIVSRIKILGRLNIAEHRLPQDGRSRMIDGKNIIDLRLSVIPCQFGESIVIRILNKGEGLRALSEIGFSTRDEAQFVDLIHKSFGVLLVTGPTGSGKTTTLYAALRQVMTRNVNIVTVEDPVEYEIEGIRQIQILPAIHFGFPQALRHILRHDPDVIMVGEIRDQETCKIALESALTGHLVLSTLHTNDAPGAITRLMEMGVEPYLLKSAIIGVLAQRLVRRNCSHCAAEEDIDPAIRRSLGVGESEVFFKGQGCERCNHTGYYGRLAVYELMVANESVRDAIEPGAAAGNLRRLALQGGMVPLTQNAIEQARLRHTSLAEVCRISMETF